MNESDCIWDRYYIHNETTIVFNLNKYDIKIHWKLVYYFGM
jgi:hypothetical protein